MPFAETWMNLEMIILSAVSQTEKDKYHMISVICGIKKKKPENRETNLQLGGRDTLRSCD